MKIDVNNISGVFEIHVTVGITLPEDVERFKKVCVDLKVKPVLIELPYGETPTQLMTSSHHAGKFPEIVFKIKDLAFKLKELNFNVLRTKIEAGFSAKGVPLNAEEVPDSKLYFEFHYKIVLHDENEKIKLAQLGKKHNAHMSRSAFKLNRDDGSFVNFLTLRLYGVGKDVAAKQHEALESAIMEEGFQLDSAHREYACYDSNVNLDKGWV